MISSTGSSHLLSAILARQTGQSTLHLAKQWLEPLEGFAISGSTRGPRGHLSGWQRNGDDPRSLLAFGELYRRGGLTAAGEPNKHDK